MRIKMLEGLVVLFTFMNDTKIKSSLHKMPSILVLKQMFSL